MHLIAIRHLTCALLGLLGLLLLTTSAVADDLERLAGKWTSERKSSGGETVKACLEVAKDKFKFRLLDASGGLRLYAEGTVKIEKHGSFQVLRFTGIKAGQTETDINDVPNERLNPYRLAGDTLTMVSNLDEERQEEPRVDIYKKVSSAPGGK